ncbi:MAG: hypothetical protein MUE58_00250 [Chitinophagaceae bacterium]|nr:hypothetical protein [Chitinophagaceae bacterium]
MIEIKRVTQSSELEGIKKLQQANLRGLLTAEERDREGFVTAEYTLEFLQQMHLAEPSIIAKDGSEVVGYALSATRDVGMKHPLLAYLFEVVDTKLYAGRPLRGENYIVVGQLCVAKGYRGLKLAQGMYDFYRQELSGKYRYCLTDIDEANPRSLKAHLNAGFKILDTLHYEGSAWHIVIWDWNHQGH